MRVWRVLLLTAIALAITVSRTYALDLTLIDAATGKPVSNVEVKVWSDNGIRCIKAPCPTNGREWKGRTNNVGIVAVPNDMVDVATSVTPAGYKAVELPQAAKKSRRWTLKVHPELSRNSSRW